MPAEAGSAAMTAVTGRSRRSAPSRSTVPIEEKLFDPRGRGVRPMKFAKSRDVVVSGGHADCVYFNHDGWFARYKILHRGSRQIMDFILPGQIFGLPACMFQRAPFSVLAITDANVSAIPFDMIDNVFERDLALAKALFWSAIQEAAILGEHLVDTGRRSASERVSHLLLELCVRLNRSRGAGDATFSIPLTQELIADALGLTTVHVNRTLRALREAGLVAVDRRSVTILDFEALSLMSDFEKSYLAERPRSAQTARAASPFPGAWKKG
jgi:CRP-like cAMP-binding protein